MQQARQRLGLWLHEPARCTNKTEAQKHGKGIVARAVTVPRHVGHSAPLALPGHGQLRCASSGLLGEALHRASDWRSLATVFALYQNWRSGTPPRKPPWPCCLYRLHRCHDPKPLLRTANLQNSGLLATVSIRLGFYHQLRAEGRLMVFLG